MAEQLVRASVMAELCGVTRPTVANWIRRGTVAGRKIGQQWFTYQSELDRLTTR